MTVQHGVSYTPQPWKTQAATASTDAPRVEFFFAFHRLLAIINHLVVLKQIHTAQILDFPVLHF